MICLFKLRGGGWGGGVYRGETSIQVFCQTEVKPRIPLLPLNSYFLE